MSEQIEKLAQYVKQAQEARAALFWDTPRTDKAAITTMVDIGTYDKPHIVAAETVPADLARQLERELHDARCALALAAEDSMGDAEIDDILRQIVAAEDAFRRDTGMKSNDALSAAIDRARAWIRPSNAATEGHGKTG
jgi:hypothetical protein